MIPGGTPFSQLNNGVKDAMVVSTGLVERQFMTKTCKKAIKTNNNNPHIGTKCREKPSTDSVKIAEEGSGEVTQTAPTPEQQVKRRRVNDGFGETH